MNRSEIEKISKALADETCLRIFEAVSATKHINCGEKRLSQLLTVLGNSANGDAVSILADQLIAALLNIDNGSDPSSVSAVIADAQTLLAGTNLLAHTAVPTNLTPNCTVKVPGQ